MSHREVTEETNPRELPPEDGHLYRRPPARELAAAAAALAVVLFLFLFTGTETFLERHVGESAYGAFQGTVWNYWYVGKHIFEPAALLKSDLQFYPFGVNIYLRIGNILDIVLFQPFQMLLPEVVARNAFLLFVLWLDAMAMYWVSRRLSGSGVLAFGAALLFSCSRFLGEELFWGRLTNLFVFPIPLFLLAWHRASLEGGARRLAMAVLWLALAGLFYVYYGVFLAGAVLLLAPCYLWRLGLRGWLRRHVPAIAILFACTAMVVLPFAIPFLDADLHAALGDFKVFRWSELSPPSDDPQDPASWYWTVVHEHSLSMKEASRRLGVLPLLAILLLSPFVRPRGRAIPWLLLAGGAWVLSLGPYLVPPVLQREAWMATEAYRDGWRLPAWWLLGYVPSFNRFGHPERFSILAQVATLMALASLAGPCMERLRSRGALLHAAGGLLVLTAVSLELAFFNRVVVVHSEPPRPSPWFHTLDEDSGVLVSLPLQASDFILYHQLIHTRPMMNGYGSFFRVEVVKREEYLSFLEQNTVWNYLQQMPYVGDDQPLPRGEHWRFFQRHGVRYFILHQRPFSPIRSYEEGLLRRRSLMSPEHHGASVRGLAHLGGRIVYADHQITVYDISSRWPDGGKSGASPIDGGPTTPTEGEAIAPMDGEGQR